jgi:tetratricopeptide (TPR) repeat protein
VEGDCGSWVIDDESGDLYGHVIAGDHATRDTYILPAYKMFNEIANSYGSMPTLQLKLDGEGVRPESPFENPNSKHDLQEESEEGQRLFEGSLNAHNQSLPDSLSKQRVEAINLHTHQASETMSKVQHGRELEHDVNDPATVRTVVAESIQPSSVLAQPLSRQTDPKSSQAAAETKRDGNSHQIPSDPDRKKAESLRLCQNRVSICERAYGSDHNLTLREYLSLGDAYFRLELFPESLRCYQKAAAGYEKMYGPDNTDVLRALDALGDTYHHLKDYPTSLQCYHRVAAGYEKVLGTKNAKTLRTFEYLGETYYQLKRYSESLKWCLRAAGGYDQLYGAQHVETLAAFKRLGEAYYFVHNYADALGWFYLAKTGRQALFGEDHPKVKGTQKWINDAENELRLSREPQNAAETTRSKVSSKLPSKNMWTSFGPQPSKTGYRLN